jgi:cell wall-associated NlpC family hydrolase
VLCRNRRFGLLFLLACVGAAGLLVPAASARRNTTQSWAQRQIKTVVAYGLMAKTVSSFKPNAVLTREELDEVLPALPAPESGSDTGTDTTTEPTGTETTPIATDPSHDPGTTDTTTTTTTTSSSSTTTPGLPRPGTPVTLSEFDASLVNQLGLTDAATRFRTAARQAGLNPPKRYGTEVVARLLGLRINHPASQDKLELLPDDEINRAEAAYSIAQVLSFQGWETASVEEASLALEPPPLNVWQKRVLNYAVSFIGYPYIWGGVSPTTQRLFGQTVPGGFDCSGLIWRVYKLHKYPGGGELSSTIRGRTTYTMSGEVGRSKRISYDELEPADVLFFGSKGPRSKPSQINHTAIYLGGGWLIQSSENGVDVVPLEGWYKTRFAWARRPLAEAGLTNGS